MERQAVNRISDLDGAVVVDIDRVPTGGPGATEKLKGEIKDGIGELKDAIGVRIAAAEPGRDD